MDIFNLNGSATTNGNGQASLTIKASYIGYGYAEPGTHTLPVVFQGDAQALGSTGNVTVTVQ